MKQHAFDHEVTSDGLDIFSANSQHVFNVHYYKKDAHGKPLESTPADVIGRICEFFRSRADSRLDSRLAEEIKANVGKLYDAQMQKHFSFNSPVYYNADPELPDDKNPLMFACFIGDLQDSIDSIGEHAKRFMTIFKNGAGIGVNVADLRPRGASLGDGGRHFAGVSGSSGAVSFMKLFNVCGEIVKSAGKRRAAIMIMMDISHPDIEEFITCKSGPERMYFENMNISVCVTDAFMKAVVEDQPWELKFKDTVWKTMPARELWAKISTHATKTGDPGIFFIDRANEFNTAAMLGPIRSTNPCGEVSIPYDTSCNLAAINLYQLATETRESVWTHDARKAQILKEVNRLAALIFPYQDALFELSKFPDAGFEKNSRAVRPVGLGLKGLGQMFYELGIGYETDEAIEFAKEIMEEITLTGLEWSTSLGKDLSTSLLEGHEDEVSDVFLQIANNGTGKKGDRWLKAIANIRVGHLRNLFVSTIAPTGNTGVMMDAYSGGMEPVFSLAYKRNTADGATLYFGNPCFERAVKYWIEEQNGSEFDWTVESVLKKVHANGGSVKGAFDDVPAAAKPPEWWEEVYVVANDIKPDRRVKMLCALQDVTSLSISGTVNLPKGTTEDQVRAIYEQAWSDGSKGVTIFVDGCLSFQPLETAKTNEGEDASAKPDTVSRMAQATK
jgi:ribonucleoside-diphosphate reductase alpha chain